MGCDIHAHIEIKLNGRWEHYAKPRINRWYSLFGMMAGVRGEGPAIAEPKGLPDDINPVTALDYDYLGEDAHTPSWLNIEEIKKINEWVEKQTHGVDDEDYFLHPYDIGENIFRIVFWFDN